MKEKLNKKCSVSITSHWSAFMWTLLQWKSNKYHTYWVFVYSLSYPACNEHAPYHIASVACPNLPQFSILSTKRTIFGTKFLNIKSEFWFSVQFLSELFVVLRRIRRGTIINLHRYSSTVRCGTVRYGTVRYGTVQYGTVQYSTVQYSTVK